MGNRIGPNPLSGYCSLVLFPKSHRVRHQFLNKIKSFFDYMMETPLKNIGARVNELLYLTEL